MDEALKAIVDKIEKKYPRFNLEKGETSITVDGKNMQPARDAVDEVDSILTKLGKFANKKGTFRVVRVTDGCAAARMIKIGDWEEEEEELSKLDFVIPPKAEDPSEEYGPEYVIVLKKG
jgi:hypothetical protein